LFHIDTDTQTLPPDDWSFWRQNAGSPTAGGGIENASIENASIGNANDASAWNINLENDADAGKIVCSVAVGVVAETYAGCENVGGELGQVLIDHSGWWSGYLHLGGISVKPGDFVDEKTQLGVISNTGTDNNHLLFMVYTGNNLDGCESNPVEGGLESFNVTFIERAITLSPIAAFTGSPVSGGAPLDVQFTDGSQPSLGSSITAWNWDFGDNGATSSEQNPAHTYNLPGTFTVSLEVTDTNAGTDKEVKADFIVVKESSSATTTTSTTTTTIPAPGGVVQGIINRVIDFFKALFGNFF
ncbi:MAG: PKD domain-containing protein, partial [Candidatus Anammoxibacter sp.]